MVVCTPFIAAGLRSLALWHAHESCILTTSGETGVVGVEQNVGRPRPPDRYTGPHCDPPRTPGTIQRSQDGTRVGRGRQAGHYRAPVVVSRGWFRHAYRDLIPPRHRPPPRPRSAGVSREASTQPASPP